MFKNILNFCIILFLLSLLLFLIYEVNKPAFVGLTIEEALLDREFLVIYIQIMLFALITVLSFVVYKDKKDKKKKQKLSDTQRKEMYKLIKENRLLKEILKEYRVEEDLDTVEDLEKALYKAKDMSEDYKEYLNSKIYKEYLEIKEQVEKSKIQLQEETLTKPKAEKEDKEEKSDELFR